MEREEGFTIVEVLVAAFILVLGSLAVFMTFAAAIHNVQRSRETQLGVSVAQREMERVRIKPFDRVALASGPEYSPEAKLPTNRVSGEGFNVNRGGTSPPLPMTVATEVTEPSEFVEPFSGGLRSNDGTEVDVYRFVVCEEPEASEGDCLRRRIVIDVLPTPKANLANYRHSYYELQSTIVNPELEPDATQPPP